MQERAQRAGALETDKLGHEYLHQHLLRGWHWAEYSITLSPNFLFIKAQIVISISQDCCGGWIEITWVKIPSAAYSAKCCLHFTLALWQNLCLFQMMAKFKFVPWEMTFSLRKTTTSKRQLILQTVLWFWCPHGTVWGFFLPKSLTF